MTLEWLYWQYSNQDDSRVVIYECKVFIRLGTGVDAINKF